MVSSTATPISTPVPAAPTAGDETGEWAAAAASERLRVLLVDADPADARQTVDKLHDAGDSISCQGATTLSGVTVDRLAGVDCVLIDPDGPDATGRSLQSLHARAPELPVVVLSSIDDPDSAARSLRLGAQEHLHKTHTDGHTLTRAIRFAVARQRLQAERRRQAEHDLELHDDVIQNLFAIGLALQITQQRTASEPDSRTGSGTTSPRCTRSPSWSAAPSPTPNRRRNGPARRPHPVNGLHRHGGGISAPASPTGDSRMAASPPV